MTDHRKPSRIFGTRAGLLALFFTTILAASGCEEMLGVCNACGSANPDATMPAHMRDWPSGEYLPPPSETQLVSISSDGIGANQYSSPFSVSDDGRYIAFSSSANNLVPDDTNGTRNVYIHDRKTGETTLIIPTEAPIRTNYYSDTPVISGGGRYVVYGNLLHDRQTGETTLWFGSPVPAETPQISANARHVAFVSRFSDVVPNDTNDARDVFVHDRLTGKTTRVSVASDGTQSNAPSGSWLTKLGDISRDGRYVTFTSDADNLVPGDTNGVPDTFLHDRRTGQTIRVSVASDGTQANDASGGGRVTADGLHVMFYSRASNLVPDGVSGVFMHNLQTGETTLLSATNGAPRVLAPGFSNWEGSSADGRYVLSHLPGNLDPYFDFQFYAFQQEIFVHDLQTGEVAHASVDFRGTFAPGTKWQAAISPDGSTILFSSNSPFLTPTDIDLFLDVFIAPNPLMLPPPPPTVEAQPPLSMLPIDMARVDVSSDGMERNGSMQVPIMSQFTLGIPEISDDNRYVVFNSDADNLVPNDTNGYQDVFVRDLVAGETIRVSVATDGTQGDGLSGARKMSPDGRYILFWSSSTNLVAVPQTRGTYYIHDLRTGETILAADMPNPPVFRSDTRSLDGRFEVQYTRASLLPEDTNYREDFYLHDLQTGELTGITLAGNVDQDFLRGTRMSPSFSDDGRYFAFSWQLPLVPEDTNNVHDVYVYDRITQEFTRISTPEPGFEANGNSFDPSISADGRFVAFRSEARNMIENGRTNAGHIYVHDRQTGVTATIDVRPDGSTSGGQSWLPNISADGKKIVFLSFGWQLVPGDTNGLIDIFVASNPLAP